jgi:ABC-2 type transport system permease protein
MTDASATSALVSVAPPPQPGIWTLLAPKWRTALARVRQERSGAGMRLLLLALVGFGFWSAVFGVSYRVLKYFRDVPDIGTLVATKLLGVLLLAFLGILLLSNIITALSTFFLAADLDLVVSAPVDWLRVYIAKLGETTAHSSWMVALVAVPIFTAYGMVFDGGLLYPLIVIAALIPFLVMPAILGTLITLLLVNIFPARKTRDLLTLVAVGGIGGVVLLLRLIRPEQLARPEGFRNLLDYFSMLQGPTNPFLPSEWAADMLMNWLLRVGDPLPILLLWTTAGVLGVVGSGLHQRLYLAGYSKAQEGKDSFVRGGGWERLLAPFLRTAGPARREFILKDLRLFFRDATQWSQLILLAVLLAVYVFNIQTLQLFTGEQVPVFFVTLVVFLNQGLAGFVLAAIAARFIFPAISLEGRELWLLKSSPLDLRAMFWSKYFIGTLPLMVVALTLTLVTNTLLHASAFIMVMSVVTISLYTMAASALALGLGALFPQFGTENAAQIPTSFGGLVFMMSSLSLLALVIVIEAIPVAGYLRILAAGGDPGMSSELILSMVAVAGLCAASTILPLRIGLRRLQELEL